MSVTFFRKQNTKNKQIYLDLLTATGELSNLFSDSPTPFLYYRAMENIFCKAFGAKNLSRSDISADAKKENLGIGLKTFLQQNGRTFQKVAEFNRESYLFAEKNTKDLISEVAALRNERVILTKRIANVSDMIYHLITRSDGHMAIYEQYMDLIQLDNIKITSDRATTIQFTDGIHEYTFSKSKSTLLQRFDTREHLKIYGFPVNVLEDPFRLLLKANSLRRDEIKLATIEKGETTEKDEVADYIILPLYSPRDGKVQEKSGLNQWNAAGRKRHDDEVYISIPSWIHKVKTGFFTYNSEDNKTDSFMVTLPSGAELSMRVAQAGGKALMSNPNSALGKWILRDVLNLKPRDLLERSKLERIGIDSVKLSKVNDGQYSLDFVKLGSYEEYKDNLDIEE